jgi:transcriptional regulator with XRE-family HTH domain
MVLRPDEDVWNAEIADVLNAHRRRLNMSMAKMAKRTGILTNSLQRLLYKQRRIKIGKLLDMARALGLKPWAVLMNDDELTTARIIGLEPNEKEGSKETS